MHHFEMFGEIEQTAAECFRMLTEVRGEERMSRALGFVRVALKRFCEGREDVAGDERCRCPCTSRTGADDKIN